jgi:hypothetical protein
LAAGNTPGTNLQNNWQYFFKKQVPHDPPALLNPPDPPKPTKLPALPNPPFDA